jgi:hypothetical protein
MLPGNSLLDLLTLKENYLNSDNLQDLWIKIVDHNKLVIVEDIDKFWIMIRRKRVGYHIQKLWT